MPAWYIALTKVCDVSQQKYVSQSVTYSAKDSRRVMPPDSSTSHRGPPIPPRTTEENIYEDVQMNTARKNLSSDAATAEEGEVYAVHD